MSPSSPTSTRPPAPTGAAPVLTVLATAAPGWARRWGGRTGYSVYEQRPGSAPDEDARAALTRACAVLRPGDADDLPEHPRVLAALRRLPADEGVLRVAAGLARLTSGVVVPFHGVPRSFGERSVGLDAALRRGRALLDDAVRLLDDDRAEPRLLRMWPHEAVIAAPGADLLVVGATANARGPLGPVAAAAVWHAPCPVVLVPTGPGAVGPPRDPLDGRG